MGIIDDYINSLEGQSSVDPLEVARKMHELHNQEIGTREAKISELTATVEAKDNDIKNAVTELTTQKARNFDLAMQLPGSPNANDNRPQEGEKPDGAQIRISDLFSPSVRARHFRTGN